MTVGEVSSKTASKCFDTAGSTIQTQHSLKRNYLSCLQQTQVNNMLNGWQMAVCVRRRCKLVFYFSELSSKWNSSLSAKTTYAIASTEGFVSQLVAHRLICTVGRRLSVRLLTKPCSSPVNRHNPHNCTLESIRQSKSVSSWWSYEHE